MKNVCTMASCPLSQISWMWYLIAVVIVFALGMLWYSVIFAKTWKQAVFEDTEQCSSTNHSILPLVIQLLCTCLLGLMYFVLMMYGSYALSLLVAVAIAGWMKATLKFKVIDWKRYFTLAGIEVGYFFLASLIFMFFATLH